MVPYPEEIDKPYGLLFSELSSHIISNTLIHLNPARYKIYLKFHVVSCRWIKDGLTCN